MGAGLVSVSSSDDSPRASRSLMKSSFSAASAIVRMQGSKFKSNACGAKKRADNNPWALVAPLRYLLALSSTFDPE
eukprot:scaffold788_cov231-Pinguiococcus_pyrenoidosus.AAC.18